MSTYPEVARDLLKVRCTLDALAERFRLDIDQANNESEVDMWRICLADLAKKCESLRELMEKTRIQCAMHAIEDFHVTHAMVVDFYDALCRGSPQAIADMREAVRHKRATQ